MRQTGSMKKSSAGAIPTSDPMEDLTSTLFNVLFTLAVIAGTVTVMSAVMKFFDDTLSDR